MILESRALFVAYDIEPNAQERVGAGYINPGHHVSRPEGKLEKRLPLKLA